MSRAEAPPAVALRLPELDEPTVPGTRLVRYSFSLALGAVALLIGLLAAVACSVDVSVAPGGAAKVTAAELIRGHLERRQAAVPGRGETRPEELPAEESRP